MEQNELGTVTLYLDNDETSSYTIPILPGMWFFSF